MVNKYNFKLYKEFNSSLKLEWESIEEEIKYSPFQSFEWLSHWYNTVGIKIINYELFIIVIKFNDKVTDIFPLCVKKKNFIKILEWIGGVNTDYMSSIHTSDSVVTSKLYTKKNIWSIIKKNIGNFDLVYLEKQPDYFNKEVNFFLNFFIKKKSIPSYKALFRSDWDSYKTNFISKKILSDNKRQLKRLNSFGKLEFIIPETDNEKQNIINEMIYHKKKQYDLGNYNMFDKLEYEKLYKNCKYTLGRYGKVHISCLKLNSKIIASHWGLISNDTFYYLMPAYNDRDWGKYSPGNILLEFLMEWSNKNNIKNFDFTDGYAKYKEQWSNKKIFLYDTFYPVSIKGVIYTFLKNIRDLLKFKF